MAVTPDQVKALGLATAGLVGAPLISEALGRGYYKRAEEETDRIASTDPRAIAKKKAILQAHGREAPGSVTIQSDPRFPAKSGGFFPGKNLLIHGPEASQFVMAHELGHRAIAQQPGLMQQVQEKTYGGITHPLVQTGLQIAAGAFAPSTRRALAYGLGATYLNQLGTIASEAEATRRGGQYLEAAGSPITPAMHAAQLSSYGVMPAVEALVPIAIGRGLRSLASKLK